MCRRADYLRLFRTAGIGIEDLEGAGLVSSPDVQGNRKVL